ncbi:hypothetical protein HQ447_19770 [bacterium]|nr:hypothetical protein [bacterium]
MQLLLNEAIYRTVIVELLPQTQKFLWIVTADIKDLHLPKGRRFVPLLEISLRPRRSVPTFRLIAVIDHLSN